MVQWDLKHIKTKQKQLTSTFTYQTKNVTPSETSDRSRIPWLELNQKINGKNVAKRRVLWPLGVTDMTQQHLGSVVWSNMA